MTFQLQAELGIRMMLFLYKQIVLRLNVSVWLICSCYFLPSTLPEELNSLSRIKLCAELRNRMDLPKPQGRILLSSEKEQVRCEVHLYLGSAICACFLLAVFRLQTECVGQMFLGPFGWKSSKGYCKNRQIPAPEYLQDRTVVSKSVLEEKHSLPARWWSFPAAFKCEPHMLVDS